ncbi:MAG: ferrous iron transport protein A [Aquificaceae bacterium]|nr:MAG: ferrous iron transport protein A [Aquificaceae bacterium]
MSHLSLMDANESELFNITDMNTADAMRTRLLGMGLGVGLDVGVLRNRRGDVVLASGNTRISLSREIADQIKVKSLGVKI